MDPWSNFVGGNTSLQLSSFLQVGGHTTVEPMVEVRILVSRSRIHYPSRIVEVERQPDVFSFLLSLPDLFPDQLRRLQVEYMLSHIGHPHYSDIDFWTEQISSYALHAANAAVFRICSGLLIVVHLNISQVWSSEAEPVIDEELLPPSEEAAGTGGWFGAVPASESSIEALETKRHRGDGKDESTCAICLEGFVAGDKLTVMPCSHEFHHPCATKWLERSNYCPLCRYAMPTVDGEGVTA